MKYFLIRIIFLEHPQKGVNLEETKEEVKYKAFASKMREDLYRNLKLLSVAEGKSVQILLEEAVAEYLNRHMFSREEGAVSGVREIVMRYGAPEYGSKKGKPKE